MHLIAPLASGVRGGELGTAQLFRRGTSTRVTWYEDFEGHGANATGDDITLDSYGGAVVFVNELTTVVVKDASGTTVREFTAGDSAAAVEVVSDSFTGTDYDSALTGTNKPATLLDILNRWNNSAGTTDWQVTFGGTSVNLDVAVAGNILINVKSPSFGAKGDGTTDDTSAINAAAAFADSVGNATIYFPPGDYRITATIDLPDGVSMLGSAPLQAQRSRILRSTSSFAFVTIDSGATSENFVSKLAFQDADTGTNVAFFTVPSASRMRMERVVCSPPSNAATNGAPIFANDPGELHLTWCTFSLRGATGRLATRSGGSLSRETVMNNTTVSFSGNINFSPTYCLNGLMRLQGCIFQAAVTTGTTLYANSLLLPYTPSVITGNIFSSLVSDIFFAISAFAGTGAGTVNGIVESGNCFADNFFNVGDAGAQMNSFSAMLRVRTYTLAAPGTIGIDEDAGVVVVTTTGAAGIYTVAFGAFANQSTIMLIVNNTSANAHTIATTGTSPADAGTVVAAGLIYKVIYVRTTAGATTSWFRMTGITVSTA